MRGPWRRRGTRGLTRLLRAWAKADEAALSPIKLVFKSLGSHYDEAETIRYIKSANLQRRELDPGQRVILIIKLPAMRPAASARRTIRSAAKRGRMTIDDLTGAIARWMAAEDRCNDAARCLSRGNCACVGRGRRLAAYGEFSVYEIREEE